jgi:hypothetical protein
VDSEAPTSGAHGTAAAGGGWRRWKIWGGEGGDDVAWWDPRVGNKNRETAGANCVLGMKIFLLHPQ